MRLCLVLMMVAFVAYQSEAQSTIQFGFDGLPLGTVLGEQFSELGVHFAGDGRYQYPSVIAAPPFPQPPAAHVAYAFPAGRNLGIWFDHPIASVSMDRTRHENRTCQ